MKSERARFVYASAFTVAACLGPAWLAVSTAGARQSTGTIRGTVTCRGAADCTGAIVFIEKIQDRTFRPGPDVVMDQAGLKFIPHVLPVVTGTRVAFPNSDEVRHNVFSASEAKRFNLGTYPKGTVKYVVFDKPGIVELLCNVHAEMSAYVVVADTPYAALVQPDGTYVLRDVPSGAHTVIAWHEELEPQRRQMSVASGEVVVAAFELRRES